MSGGGGVVETVEGSGVGGVVETVEGSGRDVESLSDNVTSLFFQLQHKPSNRK